MNISTPPGYQVDRKLSSPAVPSLGAMELHKHQSRSCDKVLRKQQGNGCQCLFLSRVTLDWGVLIVNIYIHSEVVKSHSRVRLSANPWTIAYQAPLSMGFSRQWSWSGLPFPSPGNLPDPGIEPGSPAL